MRSKVTISDVARAAGVSAQTVSRTLNGKGEISPGTRRLVLDVIDRLGYRPSSIARSLATNRTLTLGLVVPDIANPFYVPIVRSIEGVMNRRNYNVILCNTEENPERERTYIQLLRQREVDGLIIAPTGANHDLLLKLHASGKPVVLIDRYFPAAGSDQFLPTVITDNLTGSRRATCHLLEQGHRRIALLLNDLPISTGKERYDGYVQAFREMGVSLDPALIKYCTAHVADARRLIYDLLSQPDRPTAIFATNSPLTIGTLLALRDLRLKCPEDVSVIGFDDLTEISPTGPVITTVSQPAQEIGRRAAELFLLYLDGNPPPAEIYRLDTHFVAGETTARPRPH